MAEPLQDDAIALLRGIHEWSGDPKGNPAGMLRKINQRLEWFLESLGKEHAQAVARATGEVPAFIDLGEALRCVGTPEAFDVFIAGKRMDLHGLVIELTQGAWIVTPAIIVGAQAEDADGD